MDKLKLVQHCGMELILFSIPIRASPKIDVLNISLLLLALQEKYFPPCKIDLFTHLLIPRAPENSAHQITVKPSSMLRRAATIFQGAKGKHFPRSFEGGYFGFSPLLSHSAAFKDAVGKSV